MIYTTDRPRRLHALAWCDEGGSPVRLDFLPPYACAPGVEYAIMPDGTVWEVTRDGGAVTFEREARRANIGGKG